MNTGLQDAINLGWKLGLVCRGKARAELLDTYEIERLPVIKKVLFGTDVATRAVTIRHTAGQHVVYQLGRLLARLRAGAGLPDAEHQRDGDQLPRRRMRQLVLRRERRPRRPSRSRATMPHPLRGWRRLRKAGRCGCTS